MSRADKIKKQYALNLALIKEYTGLSDERVSTLIYEFGERYALDRLGGEKYVNIVLQSSQYWAWWKNQWSMRDEDFLSKIELCVWSGEIWFHSVNMVGYNTVSHAALIRDKEALEALYLQHHSPEQIAQYPHRSVLEESYRMFIHLHVKNHSH